jgi:hypothetical protein
VSDHIKALNEAVLEIIQIRQKLDLMDYADPKYDELEDRLHELEDNFAEEYGETLEDAIGDVYEEHCPDGVELLSPLAYIGHRYHVLPDGRITIAHADAVYVELKDFPDEDSRIALLPNPLRAVMFMREDTPGLVVHSFEG